MSSLLQYLKFKLRVKSRKPEPVVIDTLEAHRHTEKALACLNNAKYVLEDIVAIDIKTEDAASRFTKEDIAFFTDYLTRGEFALNKLKDRILDAYHTRGNKYDQKENRISEEI